MEVRPLDASATPSPEPENGLQAGRLHLHDIDGRRTHVELLLAEVRGAFEQDRFVHALGKFREAVNISRGVQSLEEQVLQRSVKEAAELAPRNWRIAASLISEVNHLDKEQLASAAIWKDIHASQEEESAAKTLSESVELELGKNGQAAPEPALEAHSITTPKEKETQSREVAVRLPEITVPIQPAALLPSKTRVGPPRKVDWRSLQVPVSAAVTVVMLVAAQWAFRHLHFESATKPPYGNAPASAESSDDAAAKRITGSSHVSAAPTEIHPPPVVPPTEAGHADHPVEHTQVEVFVPARKPQSSEELDWSRLSAEGGISSLKDFVLKYPASVHASTPRPRSNGWSGRKSTRPTPPHCRHSSRPIPTRRTVERLMRGWRIWTAPNERKRSEALGMRSTKTTQRPYSLSSTSIPPAFIKKPRAP